jgi:hypothetical protein
VSGARVNDTRAAWHVSDGGGLRLVEAAVCEHAEAPCVSRHHAFRGGCEFHFHAGQVGQQLVAADDIEGGKSVEQQNSQSHGVSPQVNELSIHVSVEGIGHIAQNHGNIAR